MLGAQSRATQQLPVAAAGRPGPSLAAAAAGATEAPEVAPDAAGTKALLLFAAPTLEAPLLPPRSIGGAATKNVSER